MAGYYSATQRHYAAAPLAYFCAAAHSLDCVKTQLRASAIPAVTQHYPMLQRNLLYTGITRGKRLVVIVGQRKAVTIAVRNIRGRRRWSKLKEWLAAQG